MNALLTPEQRDAIRKRATYNPPLDESAYEGSGFEQAIGDVNALLRDREAIAERLAQFAENLETDAAGLRVEATSDELHEMLHLAHSKRGRAFGYELVAQDIRAIVTAIRGEK